jgi:alpha-mannosidase
MRDGAKNVLISQGQDITLPDGDYNRLYIMAAAVGGDAEGVFTITTRDGKTRSAVLGVKDWSGVTGQWDSRLVDDRITREVFAPPKCWRVGSGRTRLCSVSW